MLVRYYPEDHLFQIDSNSMGLDLSRFDTAVIYSLTWSGANYTQVLARLQNTEREERPRVVICIKMPIDTMIYEAVSRKKDFNTKFLSK
jgi:hypothetical protein